MKKYVIVIISLLLIIFCLAGCDITSDSGIRLNGKSNMTIEAGSEYAEEGVKMPSNYYYVVDGKVDTSKLDTFELLYYVFSDGGEMVKELHRFVQVVDTSAPTYQLSLADEYYYGGEYVMSDFAIVSDNYNDTKSIISSPEKIVFSSDGNQVVEFEISDSSNNSTKITCNVNVVFDIDGLLHHVYRDKPNSINEAGASTGRPFTHVVINTGNYLSYYNDGTMHYYQSVKTSLGMLYSASISISGKYNDFSHATITYSITMSGSGSVGTTLQVSADITGSSIAINSSRLITNNNNLSESDVYDEFISKVPEILNSFKEYMNNSLHLDVK